MPEPVVQAWIRGSACGYAPPTFLQIRNPTMPGKIAARLAELKIELPKAAAPVANYVPVVITGNQAFVSGQVTVWNGEFKYIGQLGKDFQVEDGQKAARICAATISSRNCRPPSAISIVCNVVSN